MHSSHLIRGVMLRAVGRIILVAVHQWRHNAARRGRAMSAHCDPAATVGSVAQPSDRTVVLLQRLVLLSLLVSLLRRARLSALVQR